MKGCCAHCGKDNWEYLEFDHLDPSTKKYEMANIQSLKTFKKEEPKCQLLCRICHAIKTKKDHDERTNGQLSYSQRTKYNIKRINEIKVKRGCEICGYTNPLYPCTLCFDHLEEFRHLKKKSVSGLVNYSWKTIQEEFPKCRVLCRNCHISHTRDQLNHYNKDSFI